MTSIATPRRRAGTQCPSHTSDRVGRMLLQRRQIVDEDDGATSLRYRSQEPRQEIGIGEKVGHVTRTMKYSKIVMP